MNLTWKVLETVLGTIGTAELALASVGGPHSVILLMILAAGYTWLMSSFRASLKQSPTPVFFLSARLACRSSGVFSLIGPYFSDSFLR